MANIYTSADQLVGKTPLLELTHIEKEYNLKAKIYAKLEYFNPAGSIKDRIAKKMIEDAYHQQRPESIEEKGQGVLFDDMLPHVFAQEMHDALPPVMILGICVCMLMLLMELKIMIFKGN